MTMLRPRSGSMSAPVIVAFVSFLLAIATGAPVTAQSADVVLIRGTVLTMDADGSTAEALAVRNGRILEVGTTADIRKRIADDTRVIDLDGRTVLPGFFAPHDHFWGAGTVAVHYVDLNSPPIGNITSMAELVAALRERAASLPSGTWVVGRGYDDTLLREKRHPTRADLDGASTDHPIWITHVSGHLGVANSRALDIAEITGSTPSPAGGTIRKDPATGQPNGVFEESNSLVTRHIPAFTQSERMGAIEWAAADYVSKGVTTAVIAGNSSRSKIEDLLLADRRGILRGLRIITMASRATRTASATQELLADADSSRLRLGAVKIIQDGSIQGFTGYLSAPYHTPLDDDKAYVGYPRRSRAALRTLISRAHCEGYQIAVHANGDAAIDDVLDAYANAFAECPRTDARHRIEHAQMTRADQIELMRELHISPSFFAGHVFYWGDRHRDIFLGPERAARISPLNTAQQAGLTWTIHDDTPVTPVDPLHLVWAAVNRRTTSGAVLGPDERVSPMDALRAVTSNAAWQNFAERSRGSIEEGKLADLVVLSDNPLTVDPAAIRDIDVVTTIINGLVVYENGGGSRP